MQLNDDLELLWYTTVYEVKAKLTAGWFTQGKANRNAVITILNRAKSCTTEEFAELMLRAATHTF